MNKLALSAVLASLAVFPVLSQAAQTDGVNSTSTPTYGATTTPTFGANTNPNWQDNFFVAGQLGQSQFRDSSLTHNHSVFQNVRLGWRWNGIIGPEIGYAYLGRPKTEISQSFHYTGGSINTSANGSVNVRALTIGVNGKYNVYKNWFVTAHAGYLRAQSSYNVNLSANASLFGFTTGPISKSGLKATQYSNGWYGGLGVGYDVTPNFSVGVNYDNYHLDFGNNDNNLATGSGNVAAYSVSVEYRF